MQTQGWNTLRPRVVVTACLGAALIVAASLAWRAVGVRATPEPAVQGATLNRDGAAAPKRQLSSARQDALSIVSTDVSVDEIRVDGNGHLVIDLALRNVFDYFFVTERYRDQGMASAALQLHLERTLRKPALDEALALAGRYRAYLDALGAAMAAQPPLQDMGEHGKGTLDVARLASWFEQRQHLRQTFLGVQVARTWFGEEERQNQSVVARLRSMQRGEVSVNAERDHLQRTADALVALDATQASAADKRALLVREFGAEAGARFDRMQADEDAFQHRLDLYRQVLAQIRSNVTDPLERERQEQVALQQYFASDGERLRATTLVGRG